MWEVFLMVCNAYCIWLSVGIILMCLEMLMPGVFLLWLGLAAIITGIATWALELSLTWQAIIFALSSGLMIHIGRKMWKNFSESTSPNLNRRAAAFIGKTFVLESPIVNGHGRLKIGDSTWAIEGPDLPTGTHVRVTVVVGNTMTVECSV